MTFTAPIGQVRSPGTTARDTRRFVEAVRWRARCGVSRRDLPAERFGPLQTLYARLRCWPQPGVWPRVLAQVQNAPGLNRIMMDSTTNRVSSGSWREKKDSPVGQALGRSRGGFMTKPHPTCDAYGRICALTLARS